jgi:hypothetical protein
MENNYIDNDYINYREALEMINSYGKQAKKQVAFAKTLLDAFLEDGKIERAVFAELRKDTEGNDYQRDFLAITKAIADSVYP